MSYIPQLSYHYRVTGWKMIRKGDPVLTRVVSPPSPLRLVVESMFYPDDRPDLISDLAQLGWRYDPHALLWIWLYPHSHTCGDDVS